MALTRNIVVSEALRGSVHLPSPEGIHEVPTDRKPSYTCMYHVSEEVHSVDHRCTRICQNLSIQIINSSSVLSSSYLNILLLFTMSGLINFMLI